MPDRDGYPTEAELETIRTWGFQKQGVSLFLEYVQDLWTYPERFQLTGKRVLKLYLSTGGWSGNESLVSAMEGNMVFWMMTWQKSQRGGHYWFTIPLHLFKVYHA